MYRLRYSDIQEDSVAEARERERDLIQRSIDLLEAARDAGPNALVGAEATHFTVRLWSSFLEDLSSDDNQLPKELRANLISIGIWILRETEEIRQDRSDNYDGLIDISRIIRDGIR